MTRMIYTHFEFTEAAKKLFGGESDLPGLAWAICPSIGDKLSVTVNGKALTFSCKSRHFDLTESEEGKITLELDIA